MNGSLKYICKTQFKKRNIALYELHLSITTTSFTS